MRHVVPVGPMVQPQPMISPAVRPVAPVAPARPKPAEIRMQTNKGNTPNSNVTANTNNKPQSQPKGQRSGRKIGGRNTTRKRGRDNPTPVAPIPFGMEMNFNSLASVISDYSFDITGSDTATLYNGDRDDTLFRDFNVNGELPSGGTLAAPAVSPNTITNTFKILNFDFEECIKNSAYKNTWRAIYKEIFQEVMAKTKLSAGALAVVTYDNMTNYIKNVMKAYDMLVSLEVLMAWGPKDTRYFDTSLRRLAVDASSVELVSARNRLREELRVHLLPSSFMRYIRFMREYKLRNATPESTKLAFVSSDTALLIKGLVSTDSADTHVEEYINKIDAMITVLETSASVDPRLPAQIVNNVTVVPFEGVRNHWSDMHNSAVYDSDFVDVFNNLPAGVQAGSTRVAYPQVDVANSVTSQATVYAAFAHDQPSSLAVSSLGCQFFNNPNAYGINCGLPLAGPQGVVKFDGQLLTNHFTVVWINANDQITRSIEKWYEYVCDSVHKVDMNPNAITTSITVSAPQGEACRQYYAGQSNIRMAQRRALTSLFT